MLVLALDLGYRTVGWACGLTTDRDPIFGSWNLPKVGGEGAALAAFENELIAKIDKTEPVKMVCEAMLPLMAQTDMMTFRMQAGLRGIAAKEAWRGSCAFTEIDAWTVRVEVLGRAHFPKGKVKGECIRYCHEQGWHVLDDHSADAVMVWRWHQMRIGGVRPAAGPLFRGGLH
jgi:hypothetical protein